jgi:hypothetical protein
MHVDNEFCAPPRRQVDLAAVCQEGRLAHGIERVVEAWRASPKRGDILRQFVERDAKGALGLASALEAEQRLSTLAVTTTRSAWRSLATAELPLVWATYAALSPSFPMSAFLLAPPGTLGGFCRATWERCPEPGHGQAHGARSHSDGSDVGHCANSLRVSLGSDAAMVFAMW